MSRVSFTAKHLDREVAVVGGWDRPLQYYHFGIYWEKPLEDEEETVWCNLDQRVPYPMNNDGYKALLVEYDITPPEGFWEEIEKNERNAWVEWCGDNWHRRGW